MQHIKKSRQLFDGHFLLSPDEIQVNRDTACRIVTICFWQNNSRTMKMVSTDRACNDETNGVGFIILR